MEFATSSRIAIAAALLAACGPGSGSRRAQDAGAADSAGWRLATAAEGHLRLRYPDSLIQGPVDRWTGTCDHTVPISVEDTLLANRLVIAGAKAGTFDSVAPVLGFEWYSDAWWLDPTDGLGWTGGLRADTVAAGAWRALYGEVSMKFLSEDDPPVEEGQRVHYRDLVQNRFIAVGPAVEGCHVVLLWWGGNHEMVGTFQDTTRQALVRHLLATASVIER